MKILRMSIAITCLLLVASCASGGRVTDFTDRSVVYGWIDTGDVDANRLHSVVVYQLQPHSDTPYYHVKVTKFEGGYLYYAFSFPQGTMKLYEISGQRCLLVFCSNTQFSYSFGKQGSLAAAQIDVPGVYFLGALQLDDVKTGFFEAGKFDVQPATNGPSRRQMLEAMLDDARETDALVTARIEAELQRT